MDNQILLAFITILSIGVVLPIVFALSARLGPKSTNEAKEEAYESGIKMVIGASTNKFSVKYYIIAIIFVVFDIEVIFMYPWAVNLRELGFYGIIEMFVFMGILILGLIYVYGRKVLKWS